MSNTPTLPSQCANCKYWHTDQLRGGNESTIGSCGLTVKDTGAVISDRPTRRALAQSVSGSFLLTHAKFGCNQFRSKTRKDTQ